MISNEQIAHIIAVSHKVAVGAGGATTSLGLMAWFGENATAITAMAAAIGATVTVIAATINIVLNIRKDKREASK